MPPATGGSLYGGGWCSKWWFSDVESTNAGITDVDKEGEDADKVDKEQGKNPTGGVLSWRKNDSVDDEGLEDSFKDSLVGDSKSNSPVKKE